MAALLTFFAVGRGRAPGRQRSPVRAREGRAPGRARGGRVPRRGQPVHHVAGGNAAAHGYERGRGRPGLVRARRGRRRHRRSTSRGAVVSCAGRHAGTAAPRSSRTRSTSPATWPARSPCSSGSSWPAPAIRTPTRSLRCSSRLVLLVAAAADPPQRRRADGSGAGRGGRGGAPAIGESVPRVRVAASPAAAGRQALLRRRRRSASRRARRSRRGTPRRRRRGRGSAARCPEADVVVHVEPEAGSDAAIRERAQAAALQVPRGARDPQRERDHRRRSTPRSRSISSCPARMSLDEAHAVAEAVERAILNALPEVDDVQTHLEPLAEESPRAVRRPHGGGARRRVRAPHRPRGDRGSSRATCASSRPAKASSRSSRSGSTVRRSCKRRTREPARSRSASGASSPEIVDVHVHTEP